MLHDQLTPLKFRIVRTKALDEAKPFLVLFLRPKVKADSSDARKTIFHYYK